MSAASSRSAAIFEQLYLKNNPDVAEAIAKGDFSSGLDHWLLHGRQEDRLVCTKADIANHLADIRGYRSYLEICIPTTGLRYAEVDRSKFDTCHRFMYRCPDHFDDGMSIDFRSADLEIADCIRQIRDQRYDVILVDPFHAYETSLRDLRLALDLLADGGTVIVHDCDPPSEEVATTQFNAESWAGVTYKAYLDFVTERDDLVYFTVDTDWGCGVIRKKSPFIKQTAASEGNSLAIQWRRFGDDYQSAFRFLQANKVALLKLITVEEFLNAETIVQLSSGSSTGLPADGR